MSANDRLRIGDVLRTPWGEEAVVYGMNWHWGMKRTVPRLMVVPLRRTFGYGSRDLHDRTDLIRRGDFSLAARACRELGWEYASTVRRARMSGVKIIYSGISNKWARRSEMIADLARKTGA